MRTSAAFTLIELLIVVAIIAILAAIAVPNFLEAQTRSKVSRVYSDQRTIATALETYTVDNNREPIPGREYWYWLGGAGVGDRATFFEWKMRLTTPVAYMTSIPGDPFIPPGGTASPPRREDGDSYNYDSLRYIEQNSIMYNSAHAYERNLINNGTRWILSSMGPSFEELIDRVALGQTNQIYDPTNGTISTGIVARTNKGIPGKRDGA
jgi:prepilin-type N-terminal cleavage/methylation domain-containing protein